MRHANRHDLYLLLRRLTLTRSDALRILGFFRRILWRLQHNSDSDINQIANMVNGPTDLQVTPPGDCFSARQQRILLKFP